MTSDFYDAFEDPDTYPGTNVLKNKLETDDLKELESFELEMTTLRAEEPLPPGRFGPRHYKKIHHHLFQDVYNWAGQYRSVRIAKNGNPFCFPEHIDDQMRRLFNSLKDANFFKGLAADQFSESAAKFLADLNAIHAFREGNGRTQLSFLEVLAEAAGHSIDLTRIRKETFMPAMIASFGGNIEPLKKEIQKLLS